MWNPYRVTDLDHKMIASGPLRPVRGDYTYLYNCPELVLSGKKHGHYDSSTRAETQHHPHCGESDPEGKILSYEEGVMAKPPPEDTVPDVQQNTGLSGKL